MKGKNFDLDKWYCSLRDHLTKEFFPTAASAQDTAELLKTNSTPSCRQLLLISKRLVVLTEENTKLVVQNLNPQMLTT